MRGKKAYQAGLRCCLPACFTWSSKTTVSRGKKHQKGHSQKSIQLQLRSFLFGCDSGGALHFEAPEMHTDPDYDSFLADDFALGVARSCQVHVGKAWNCHCKLQVFFLKTVPRDKMGQAQVFEGVCPEAHSRGISTL